MPKSLIIGGGIVGLSTAYFLRKKGWDVTVLEKSDLSDNCSFGNMGYLSPSHIIPLAAPGMIEQGIFWMFDKKSPFYVRPSLDWQLIDWGLKFMRHCNQRHVDRSARPLLDLLLFSKDIFVDWAKNTSLSFDLQQKGCMMYYQTAKKEKAELATARMGETYGMKIRYFDKSAAQALEPDLPPEVTGGVMYEDDGHIDPSALMRQMPAWLEQQGVKIIRHAEVTGFHRSGRNITGVDYQKDGATHTETADKVILSAGSWSPQIAKLAGANIPMMPGKGYSMDIDGLTKKLQYPCIFLEAKVALTPWGNRLRIGSTMEIGAINNRIMLPRAQGIMEAVPRFMPAYMDDPAFKAVYQRITTATDSESLRDLVWFGFRPVSADGMPYIGYAPNADNLIMATGHAMLGLSLGPGTGQLVAELANGEQPSLQLDAYKVDRF
jgi:D-amino-acid dehydrogenase